MSPCLVTLQGAAWVTWGPGEGHQASSWRLGPPCAGPGQRGLWVGRTSGSQVQPRLLRGLGKPLLGLSGSICKMGSVALPCLPVGLGGDHVGYSCGAGASTAVALCWQPGPSGQAWPPRSAETDWREQWLRPWGGWCYAQGLVWGGRLMPLSPPPPTNSSWGYSHVLEASLEMH